MDIREFVEETVLQIMNGVRSAGSRWDGDHSGEPERIRGMVSPEGLATPTGERSFIVDVNFDISVVATEGTSTKGGGKLQVWGQGLAGSMGKERGTTETSRVRFKVPVRLPAGVKPKE